MGIVGKGGRSHSLLLQSPGARHLYRSPGKTGPLVIGAPGQLKIPLTVQAEKEGIIPGPPPFGAGNSIDQGLMPGGKGQKGSPGRKPVYRRNFRIFPEGRKIIVSHRSYHNVIFLPL
jgi:hypothetical protein